MQSDVRGWMAAVVAGGAIEATSCHGDRGDGEPVQPDTRFQAGSISKPVSALVLLRLGLDLDAGVATMLRSWQLPDADGVTLRHLLAHTGGTGVHGFLGYPRTADRPTLVQVLDGTPPANSEAVRVVRTVGECAYSGGGYAVAQLVAEDVTGRPFADLARELVLEPFAMVDSTFETDPGGRCASGFWPNDAPVIDGWHVHPESTAAGLWTTAADLARFILGLHRAPEANEMLTPAFGGTHGLGPRVTTASGEKVWFHGGVNCGFMAFLFGWPGRDAGLAVMTNQMAAGPHIRRVADAHAQRHGLQLPDVSLWGGGPA